MRAKEIENARESFDISGKIDTDNPIYRFYEKEVARYLKRVAPDMQRITDKQGVTWHEINVPKEAKSGPVEAFGVLGPVAAAGSAITIGAAAGNARAEGETKVDMNKIYSIESNNNPKAKSGKGAIGIGQILDALKDWNNLKPKEKYTAQDMYDAAKNKKVAEWYMNERIPQMLRAYKIADTVDNRLIAYNFGIGNLKNKKPLPKETIDYLKKYHAKEKR